MNILEKSESFLMKIKYLVHDPEMVLLDNIINLKENLCPNRYVLFITAKNCKV